MEGGGWTEGMEGEEWTDKRTQVGGGRGEGGTEGRTKKGGGGGQRGGPGSQDAATRRLVPWCF